MRESTQRSYLVAYDYGMGGLWGVIHAPSRADIADIYPELQVIDCRPDWMTEAQYSELLDNPYSLDDTPWGMLAAVVADRTRT